MVSEIIKGFILFFFCFLCFNAWSIDVDTYLTGQLAYSDVDVDSEFVNFDAPSFNEGAVGFNLALGIRPYAQMGFELGIYDIGLLEFLEFDNIEFQGIYLSAVGRVDLTEDWFLSGKAGVMTWEATADPSILVGDESDDGTTGMLSIGVGWAVSSRVEIVLNQLFVDIDHFDIKTTSVGVNFLF